MKIFNKFKFKTRRFSFTLLWCSFRSYNHKIFAWSNFNDLLNVTFLQKCLSGHVFWLWKYTRESTPESDFVLKNVISELRTIIFLFALPNSYNRICAKIKRVLRHITRSDQRRIYLIPSQGFDSLIFLPSEMKIELGLGWAHVHQVTSVVLMRFFRYAPQNNYWTPKLKWLECRSDAVPKLTKLVRRINGKVFGAKTNLS